MNLCVYGHVVVFLVLSHVGRMVVHGQENQIFRGTNINITEFLWFAAIRDSSANEFRCSGFLIGARYVLSAKHCFKPPFDVEVEIGYWCENRNNCGRTSDIISVQNSFSHRGDMMLLELDRSVNFEVQPAVPYLGKSLHPRQPILKKRRPMTLVGAGRAGTSEEVSTYVKKLEVSYLAPKKCKGMITNPSLVADHVICSTAEEQGGSPCDGDSGSALVVAGKGKFRNRDLVVALHNRGPPDCSNPNEDQVFLHFRMEDAASLLQDVVCKGDYAEDWCGPVSSSAPTIQPSLAPITTEMPTNGMPELEANLFHTFNAGSSQFCLSFNWDGSQLVAGGSSGKLLLWDPITGGDAISTFKGKERAWAVRWNPSNTVLASAGGKVLLWDMIQQDQKPTNLKPKNEVTSLAWHPNGITLASGSGGGNAPIEIWNSLSGELEQRIPMDFTVNGVSFHPDGSKLAAGLGSGTIMVLDVTDSYKVLQRFQVNSDQIRDVAYSPDGLFLAAASDDESVTVREVKSGQLLHVFNNGHKDHVLSVAWSPNSRYVLSGSKDGTIMIWDGRNGGEPLQKLEEAHNSWITAVDWSPDGVHVASASYDTTVKVWTISEK